jgi:hypothetical protein
VGVADDNIIVGKEVKRMEVYVKTKKKIGLFVIIVAALAIMMIGFRWFFFEVLKSDQMLDGLVEFRASVVKDMESGSKSGMYFVKNVKKNDVPNINKYIDSAYGSVDTYRIIIESGDYLAIQFNFELSDNYYVVRKYLYGTDIPGDNERALRIYDVVDGFIDRYITDGMTDFDKELAVHDYIVSNCYYGYPENKDDAYTAYGALVLGRSVCDGYAEAFFVIMSCLGVDCDIVVGSTDEGLHAWNQVALGGEWYNIDLTWDDSLPDMGNYIKHTYVNVADDVLERTHIWQKQFYRECTEDTYNFYSKKFYRYECFDDYVKGVKIQLGKNKVVEAAVRTDEATFDLSFFYNYGNINSINYAIEDMGEYKIIVVYLNFR